MDEAEDLKQVLKQALEKRGSLEPIRAKLRSDILALLNDSLEEKTKGQEELTPLVNQIFIEYLTHHNLAHTLSVFLAETGSRCEAGKTEQLARDLNLSSKNNRPIIYSMVEKCGNKSPDEI
ncbi:hypothetical protein K7432_000150 [Basidiobolus ranarum]|uniref:LisH domain-containing protein n=1 Tax=Basidiobolus ranarum TaxID=34480 RepID=A0ABR2WBP6_9FUNG